MDVVEVNDCIHHLIVPTWHSGQFVGRLVQYHSLSGTESPVYESFVCFMEKGDINQGEVVNTVQRMIMDHETGTGKVISVASFKPVEKGTARGLEAADLVAWQWNK